MSNGGGTPININTETLAQFLAKAVSDGTYGDVIEALKVDTNPAAASDIRNDGGQLWSNVVDDMFKLVYTALHKSGKIWRAADLAGLQATGSDSDLTEDDLGIATDTGRLYRCTGVTGASTSTWGGLLVGESLTVDGPLSVNGGGATSVIAGGTIDLGNNTDSTQNVRLRATTSALLSSLIGGTIQWQQRSNVTYWALARYVGGVFQEETLYVDNATGAITLGSGADITLVGSLIPSGNRNVGSSGALYQALWSADKSRIRAAAFTALVTAGKGERALYDASGGTFQINAPVGANTGDRFAVKEVANDATVVTIAGNGSNIESPTGATPASTVGASFTIGVPYVSIEWEYDGSVWRII